MSRKSKIARTEITDLPEVDVEMTETEMRIVAGGLKSGVYGCGIRVAFRLGDRTQYNTNGDWDSD